jgi:hypothetical protein
MSLLQNGVKRRHRARARASATASDCWSWDTTDEAGSQARLSRCTSGSDDAKPSRDLQCCKTDVLVYAYTYDDFDATKSCEPTPAQCAASLSSTSTATASPGTLLSPLSSLALP